MNSLICSFSDHKLNYSVCLSEGRWLPRLWRSRSGLLKMRWGTCLTCSGLHLNRHIVACLLKDKGHLEKLCVHVWSGCGPLYGECHSRDHSARSFWSHPRNCRHLREVQSVAACGREFIHSLVRLCLLMLLYHQCKCLFRLSSSSGLLGRSSSDV